MSIDERKTLLATHLETLSGIPPIDYPDKQFRPPNSGPHLRVRYLLQQPQRLTHSGGHIEQFEMTVSCIFASQRTAGQGSLLPEQIQAHFVTDQQFAGTGETTRVRQKPTIWSGYNDPKTGSWIVPVSIYLETLPS